MSTRDEMAEVFLPGIEALGGGSGRTATASGILSDLVASMRPRQWTKNALVFVAPAAAGVLVHRADLLHTLATFGIFCAAASGVYLVNDVTDAGADRNHPVKCHRPIARAPSPRVSPWRSLRDSSVAPWRRRGSWRVRISSSSSLSTSS